MRGSRFQLAYGKGETLTPEELKKLELKDKEIKIKDNTGELPDLIVNDVGTARKYIDYMNRPQDEKKITDLVLNIRGTLEKLNNLNQALIQPEKIIIGEDEEVFAWADDDDPKEILNLLNNLNDENEFNKLKILYLTRENKALKKELDFIQNSITESIKHQKTELAQKALKKVIEDYNNYLINGE